MENGCLPLEDIIKPRQFISRMKHGFLIVTQKRKIGFAVAKLNCSTFLFARAYLIKTIMWERRKRMSELGYRTRALKKLNLTSVVQTNLSAIFPPLLSVFLFLGVYILFRVQFICGTNALCPKFLARNWVKPLDMFIIIIISNVLFKYSILFRDVFHSKYNICFTWFAYLARK